jgi:hypothetical protein
MLADVGIPMIFVQVPAMVCALVPVIIIEANLIRRWVPLSSRDAIDGVVLANLCSTFVGIPIAWLIMLLVELALSGASGGATDMWPEGFGSLIGRILWLLLNAAWIGPGDGVPPWTIPVAAAALLIPSFFVSVWFERRIGLWWWPTSDPRAVRRGVYMVNLASYALLLVLACGWIGYEILTPRW